MNSIVLCGKLLGEPKLHHESHGNRLVCFNLEILRKSGIKDVLNILINEKMIFDKIIEGDFIKIEGEIRTYNIFENEKRITNLFVLAHVINKIESDEIDCFTNNIVEIDGFVCNKPFVNITKTERKISTIMLAVPRRYNNSSYIPCICWGSNSIFANHLNVSDNIKITGRLQSRAKNDKTYFEVSVQNINKNC